MLTAKQLTPEHWILCDQQGKVGHVRVESGQLEYQLRGQQHRASNWDQLRSKLCLRIQQYQMRTPLSQEALGWPSAGVAHNVEWHAQLGVPLYTSKPRSRSRRCAGWYLVQSEQRPVQLMFCPKLIVLQRMQFQGPFHSEQQARQALNSASPRSGQMS